MASVDSIDQYKRYYYRKTRKNGQSLDKDLLPGIVIVYASVVEVEKQKPNAGDE